MHFEFLSRNTVGSEAFWIKRIQLLGMFYVSHS